MSAEEFWKCDPQLFISYRNAFINKKKRELQENDYKSWLLGLYIHDGNGKLFTSLKQFIGNMVSKHKDTTKIDTYPTKPYYEMQRLNEIEQENKIKEKTKREEKYKEYESSLMYFGTMKQRYLDNLKENQKKGK